MTPDRPRQHAPASLLLSPLSPGACVRESFRRARGCCAVVMARAARSTDATCPPRAVAGSLPQTRPLRRKRCASIARRDAVSLSLRRLLSLHGGSADFCASGVAQPPRRRRIREERPAPCAARFERALLRVDVACDVHTITLSERQREAQSTGEHYAPPPSATAAIDYRPPAYAHCRHEHRF